MSKNDNISMSVIRRLPRYYRFLSELDNQNVDRISSIRLAQIMHVTASQVRQDLNCFGGFGQQGYGYSVRQLKEEITNILGLNNGYKTILIGAGHFGSALANHLQFDKLGFHLVACFDTDPEKVGKSIGEMTIRDEAELEDFCRRCPVDSAILTIPKEAVEKVISRLYAMGIKSYWNFSHYDIAGKFPDTIVENVHLSDKLMTLCYRMTN